MISVRAKGDISNSNNNLMLGDCIGERLTLEFALRYWSCKLVISRVLTAKYLGKSVATFIALLVVR